MLPLDVYRSRRARLRTLLTEGILLLRGHRQLPLNLPSNLSEQRQGSHILFLTGCRDTNATILLRLDTGRLELFVPRPDPEDNIWHGESQSLEAAAAAIGADASYPLWELEATIRAHLEDRVQPILTLPSADPDWRSMMAHFGLDLPELGGLKREAPSPLADAMVALRLTQDPAALAEMRRAAQITAQVFQAMMVATLPGGHETQLRGLGEGMLRAAGVRPSYAPIVTVRGEILHCRDNPNTLEGHQLLLVDLGCETAEGYASDVTRTWPVGGRFDEAQRAVYEIVLDAQVQCIDRIQPGVEFADLHAHASRVLAAGLKDLGILRGPLDAILAHHAQALFFPHGLGHLIGLDVHDIEDLGDRAGYAPGRRRSSHFGLRNLRLDRPLESGMVITIEPGLYFIPALLKDPAVVERYKTWVDFDKAHTFLDFGGIRIEDDVVVGETGPEVLSAAIPKTIAALEELVGSIPAQLGALATI